jgi:DnaJ-class molecular chaperone
MAEDFYQVLGVGKHADIDEIKQAYRKEAKKSHPDACGTEGSAARFRDVEEAYETLRDKDRREAYDQELDRRSKPARPGGGRPPWPAENAVAPGPRGSAAAPWSGLLRASAPLLEVLLSPEEALEGVTVPVELPAVLPCPACGSAGLWEQFFCDECGGTGRVAAGGRIAVELPPGVRHGAEFLCRFRRTAVRGVGFRIRVLVGAP